MTGRPPHTQTQPCVKISFSASFLPQLAKKHTFCLRSSNCKFLKLVQLTELNLSVNVFQQKNNVTWRVKIPMKKYITTFWMGHFLTQSQSLCCLNNKANHRSVKWELPNGRGQGCNTWFWMIMYSFKNSFFCKCVQSTSKDRAPSVLDLMKHGLKYYIILIDLFFFKQTLGCLLPFVRRLEWTTQSCSDLARLSNITFLKLYTIIFKNYWWPLENIYSTILHAKVTIL